MESRIECISSTDGIDADQVPHPHTYSKFSSSKPSSINNLNSVVIHPGSSVHELLECPVCTNSMYPPIHQPLFSKMHQTGQFSLETRTGWITWLKLFRKKPARSW